MHEASQKFENTLNQCNSWLDNSEKDLSPDKYKLEPLELIVAEKNVEKILVCVYFQYPITKCKVFFYKYPYS